MNKAEKSVIDETGAAAPDTPTLPEEENGAKEEAQSAEPRKGPDIAAMLAQLRSGSLELEKPILARGNELTALPYDFGLLTGMELLDALDADPKGDLFGKTTNKQALALFAKAAAKATPDLDERDIRERMTGMGDVLNAVKVALAFFRATSRLASMRIKGA